jgi:hypothetical protein
MFRLVKGTPVDFSAGVSSTKNVVGNFDVYTVTAAGVSDTVTIG